MNDKSKNGKEAILAIFDCQTNYSKLSSSKQQTCIISRFLRIRDLGAAEMTDSGSKSRTGCCKAASFAAGTEVEESLPRRHSHSCCLESLSLLTLA